jgi:hypothetical protein
MSSAQLSRFVGAVKKVSSNGKANNKLSQLKSGKRGVSVGDVLKSVGYTVDDCKFNDCFHGIFCSFCHAKDLDRLALLQHTDLENFCGFVIKSMAELYGLPHEIRITDRTDGHIRISARPADEIPQDQLPYSGGGSEEFPPFDSTTRESEVGRAVVPVEKPMAALNVAKDTAASDTATLDVAKDTAASDTAALDVVKDTAASDTAASDMAASDVTEDTAASDVAKDATWHVKEFPRIENHHPVYHNTFVYEENGKWYVLGPSKCVVTGNSFVLTFTPDRMGQVMEDGWSVRVW